MDSCLGSYRLRVSNEYDSVDLSLLYEFSGVCQALKVEKVIYVIQYNIIYI